MSRRASGGTLAAWIIIAAIVGFAGGAFFGVQSGGGSNARADDTPQSPVTSSTTEPEKEPTSDEPTVELAASPASVAAKGDISLTVQVEPVAEGVRMRLERRIDGGEWSDFWEGLDDFVADENGQISARTVRTEQVGVNEFRLVGLDDSEGLVSNTVTVTVGG